VANRLIQCEVYADTVDRAIAFSQTVFGWSIAQVAGMDSWRGTTGAGEPGSAGGPSQRARATQGTVPQCGVTGTVDVAEVPAAAAAGGSAVHQPEAGVWGGRSGVGPRYRGEPLRHHAACPHCEVAIDA
jgi:predicted enzyme related to lactoylglutathione lyase